MPAASNSREPARPAHHGSGVYLSDTGADAPRTVVLPGKRLSRFMDSIYLDRPCERLSPKKIRVLNAARRPLLDRTEVASVNSRVRGALSRGIRASNARSVLEWGCGFHRMDGLLDDLEYAGVDIDPAVVEAARSESDGGSFYVADRELEQITNGRYDAVVSAFVFHFRLPRLHLDSMRRILAPDGIILANVYRRTPRSRRELMAEFNRVGFRVTHMWDEAGLCADQEFWCMTHAGVPDRGRSEAALLAVHEATGPASGSRAPAISVNGLRSGLRELRSIPPGAAPNVVRPDPGGGRAGSRG